MTDLQVRPPQESTEAQRKARNVPKLVAAAVTTFLVAGGIVAFGTVRSPEPAGRSQAAIAAESARLTGLAESIANQEQRPGSLSTDLALESLVNSRSWIAYGARYRAMGEAFLDEDPIVNRSHGQGGVIEGTE